ncbi:hypothetical protein JFL43_02995 [Viridibacillus sp. YIM B01967]|uniref:Group-specific protein n=1 Tax=Viridibacillus soli TaxID=2798301 RepID=A0ABS1H369_9BACL|nr:hypothetical protein [Viridibacillus soli]MBK3493841.1 hypothetical protein [Viridibacillus soli]
MIILVFFLPVAINKSTQSAQWVIVVMMILIGASAFYLLLVLITAEEVPSIFYFLSVPAIALVVLYLSYRICIILYEKKDL